MIDLENRIKEADMIHEKFTHEYKGLETPKVRQDKELNSLIKTKESTEVIEDLKNKLKEAKEKNKELEKRLQTDATNYKKQHENFVNLQEKLQRIRELKRAWKNALAEDLPAPSEDGVQRKKPEDEMMKNTIALIRKKMDFETNAHRKQIESMQAEIAQLQLSIKEIEQENKLNVDQIKKLKALVKHKQLIPLKPGASQACSPQPMSNKLEL